MADINSILRQMSNENTAKTFQFNASEAQKARDFQANMSNTSHQREVEDLKRAGLNPVLSANGGAQSYSTSSASGSADNSAVGVLASIYQTKMNNDNARKIANQQNKIARANKKTDLQIAKINAAASNYASNNSYAASRYSADQARASSTYNTDVSSSTSKYSTDRTKYGMAYNLGQGLTGHSARSLGKKGNTVLNRAWNYIKRKF